MQRPGKIFRKFPGEFRLQPGDSVALFENQWRSIGGNADAQHILAGRLRGRFCFHRSACGNSNQNDKTCQYHPSMFAIPFSNHLRSPSFVAGFRCQLSVASCAVRVTRCGLDSSSSSSSSSSSTPYRTMHHKITFLDYEDDSSFVF